MTQETQPDWGAISRDLARIRTVHDDIGRTLAAMADTVGQLDKSLAATLRAHGLVGCRLDVLYEQLGIGVLKWNRELPQEMATLGGTSDG
jgi:hypothetical protein